MVTLLSANRLIPSAAAMLLCLAVISGLPGHGARAQMVIEATTTVTTDGPPELPRPAEPAAEGIVSFRPITTDDANTLVETTRPDAPDQRSLAALPAGPLPAPPVVVELFTAQGCSACPPADALLADMADRPDLLALAFHVDYWDYLGWEDGFASPAFTRRQQAYAHVFHERGLYTPQIIIGGADPLLTPRPADLDMLIAAHRARPPMLALSVERESGRQILTLAPQRAMRDAGGIEVLFLRYVPRRLVQMKSGENQGRQIEYRNIVARIDKLADWDGRKLLRLGITPGAEGEAELDARGEPLPADTRHAIIVQQAGPGPILAAIRLD